MTDISHEVVRMAVYRQAMGLTGLYAIIDPEHCGIWQPRELAQQLLEGGCGALQLRAKKLSDAAYADLAQHLAYACRARGVPFFVNDRVHLVKSIGADGVHLGQNDMPIAEARELLPDHVIGLSTHSPDQATTAFMDGLADLIGFGPMFDTRTKEDADPVVGLDALRQVCQQATLPVVAIGGIELDRAAKVFGAGAHMVAMISALSQSAQPQRAAARVHGLYGTSTYLNSPR